MKRNNKIKRLASIALSCLITVQCVGALPISAEVPYDIPVPQFRAMKTDVSNANVIPAYVDGQGLIKKVYANDTVGVAYGEAIARVSALGILPREGNMSFSPGSNMSGFEVIEGLVNLVEGDATTMGNVYNLVGANYSEDSVRRVKNQEYQRSALRLGIITNNDLSILKNNTTKEQTGVWLAKALAIAPNNSVESVYSFSDWSTSNPRYRNTLEALIKKGIMPLNNDGSLGPKDLILRGEFAKMIESALQGDYASQNTTSQFGLVISKEKNEKYVNNQAVNETVFTIKKMDGSIDQLVTKSYPGKFNTEDFVVYKNDRVSNSSYLDSGDQIEYLIKNGQVIYAEALQDGQLITELNKRMKEQVNYGLVHFGKVAEIINESIEREDTIIDRTRIRVSDYNGNTFDIIVDENINTGYREDITTFKNNRAGNTKMLEVGDEVEYLVNDRQEVVYIKVDEIRNEEISGTIRTVTPAVFDPENVEKPYTPAEISIFGYDNSLKGFPVAPYANILVNGRLADISELVYGMHVKADVSNGYIITLRGESFTDDPGYIPEYGKMRMGKVDRVYNDGFYLMRPDGKREFYKKDLSTIIMKEGHKIAYEGIRVGDDVKLYFNDIYTDFVAKIEVEPQAKVFKQIYKGELIDVNEIKGEITINHPEYLKNEAWTADDDYSKVIKLDKYSEIYAGNRAIRFDQLEREALGNDVYVVVADVYGKDKAVKLSVKSGGESVRSTSVFKVDHTLNEMETITKENYNLTDGTIVVKDGRVVPASAIDRRDDILVVGDTFRGGRFTDQTNALVVKVVTQYDDIFDSIRIGILEDVNPGSVTFKYHAKIDGNKFNEVNPNETKPQRFFTKTIIKDVTDPKDIKVIDPSKFFNKDYARVENESEDGRGLPYESYYAFMVVNPGDESIIAMNLRFKGLMPFQNIDDKVKQYKDVEDVLNTTFEDSMLTRGVVTDFDKTWHRVKITDAHDYADYTGQWTPTKTDIFIDYKDAIIIEDTIVRSVDDIQIGDYLYVMRIKDEALVIFIER